MPDGSTVMGYTFPTELRYCVTVATSGAFQGSDFFCKGHLSYETFRDVSRFIASSSSRVQTPVHQLETAQDILSGRSLVVSQLCNNPTVTSRPVRHKQGRRQSYRTKILQKPIFNIKCSGTEGVAD